MSGGLEGWQKVGVVAGVIAAIAGVIAVWPSSNSEGGSRPTSTQTTVAAAPPTAITPPFVPITTAPPSVDGGGNSGESDTGGGGGSEPPAPPPPAAPQPAIVRVDVTPRGGGALTQIGPGTWQLPHYVRVIPPPNITFDWVSQGPGGEVSGLCTVSATIDGPPGSDYPVSRQSGECSGSPNKRLDVYDPGTYTISVTVTPPDGGGPVTGQGTFTLVSG